MGITHIKFKKWQNTFLDNLLTSIQLHKINRLIVINHQDCGATKIANYQKEFDSVIENKIHQNSLKELKKILKKRLPKLYSEFYLMNLKSLVKKFNV